MPKVTRVTLVLAAILAWGLAISPSQAFAAKGKDKIDINSATQAELENLPGVGAATAAKIIAGRPFSSVQDLSRAGVSAATIDKIKPLVKAGRGSSAAAETAKETKAAAAPKEEKAAKATKESKGEMKAEAHAPAAPAASQPPPAAASKPAASAPKASSSNPSASASAGPPPVKGMVWVNTETKVFHREGDKWYGNTKHGKYMNEADALKAGYRESKEHLKKS
jgi:hypothetical protein